MMSVYNKRLKILSGNANLPLAQEIAEYLGLYVASARVSRFADGEICVAINESVRGVDIFIIQPTCPPVNDNLMELLIMMDAVHRASAFRINAVIPYYGYARQDRKTRARDPITAKMIANLLTIAGAHRVITMDLHAGQIQGFYDIPVDHLPGVPILADYFKEKELENIVVVSPDMGGVTRAREMAERLGVGASIAIIDKRRPEPNVSEVMNVIGEVKNKSVILVDDIIDTGGTLTQGAEVMLERGACEVYACATHALLSGPAVERLAAAPIKELVITNTIPLPPEKKLDKMTVLSVAPLLGEAIIRIHEDLSVSRLFDM